MIGKKMQKNVLLICNECFSVIGPVPITWKTLYICTQTKVWHAQHRLLQTWMDADVHNCPPCACASRIFTG